MQSISRKLNRINRGLQNPNPSSTKISKHTPAESAEYNGHRKSRFARTQLGGLPKFIRNLSFKTWIERNLRVA